MAKPAVTKSAKTKVGDVQRKGKKKSNRKVTNQGNGRNSHKTDKNSVREKKGHS